MKKSSAGPGPLSERTGLGGAQSLASASPEVEGHLTCPQCGAEAQADAAACPSCGQPLGLSAARPEQDRKAPLSTGAFFGEFLVQRHYIRPQHLAEALTRQRREQVPVGQIALRRGFLRIKDVMTILDVQAFAPHLRFGEIAVELGLLSEDDLALILGHQQLSRQPLGELLVSCEVLTVERLEAALAEFAECVREDVCGG